MTTDELVLQVYKQRLEDNRPGAVARMIEKDGDDGSMLANRAESYRPIINAVISVLERNKCLATT